MDINKVILITKDDDGIKIIKTVVHHLTTNIKEDIWTHYNQLQQLNIKEDIINNMIK